mmetsp:Transcript_102229/g.284766  ORF Transcript_102229/g.284766 Transcript_102229/m.284766 type:complete len:380 (-) Transcript_102229:838-1977(-)
MDRQRLQQDRASHRVCADSGLMHFLNEVPRALSILGNDFCVEQLVVCHLVRLQAVGRHLLHKGTRLLGAATGKVRLEHSVVAHDVHEAQLLHLLKVPKRALEVPALDARVEEAVVDQGAQLRPTRAQAVEDGCGPAEVALTGVRLDHRRMALEVAVGCATCDPRHRSPQGRSMVGEALSQCRLPCLCSGLQQRTGQGRVRPDAFGRHLPVVEVARLLESLARDQGAASGGVHPAPRRPRARGQVQRHDARREVGVAHGLARLQQREGQGLSNGHARVPALGLGLQVLDKRAQAGPVRRLRLRTGQCLVCPWPLLHTQGLACIQEVHASHGAMSSTFRDNQLIQMLCLQPGMDALKLLRSCRDSLLTRGERQDLRGRHWR